MFENVGGGGRSSSISSGNTSVVVALLRIYVSTDSVCTTVFVGHNLTVSRHRRLVNNSYICVGIFICLKFCSGALPKAMKSKS
jgi:hypothetical protein